MAAIGRFLKETRKGYRIYIRYHSRYADVSYATEYYTTKNEWDGYAVRQGRGKDNARIQSINDELLRLEEIVAEVVERLQKRGFTHVTSIMVRREVDILSCRQAIQCDFDKYWEEFVKHNIVCDKTRTNYGSIKRSFRKFILTHNYIHNINLVTKEDMEALYLQYVSQYALSTADTYFSSVSSFFGYLEKREVINRNPCLGVKVHRAVFGTPYFLTTEELKKVYEYIPEHWHSAMEDCREMFCFQSCIGCRISDLRTLKKENFTFVDGTYWLEYIAQKTSKRNAKTLRVPLNEMAESIYLKRRVGRQHFVFRRISPFYYNGLLKKILTECGITRVVTIRNPKTGLAEQRRICDIASSHLARRTFIGNLYKKVQDVALISSMSGHCEGSKAFARYRTIDDEMKMNTIALLGFNKKGEE